MPRKPISFELDFMIKDIFPRFTVKQFDDVSFNIKPKNQGLDYNTTGMIGKIFVGVNNDMFMQTTGITVSNNNINILLDKNMLQKSGRAYAEVELTDNAGTITSSSFIFDIDPKIGEGGMIPGEYEGFVEKYERLISEFKSQVNSCVNNANTLVNKTINNCNTSVDNKLNTVDGLINIKISDFEKRFNRLTVSQQQSTEVIAAREDFKGNVYDSLKERIDYTDKILRESTVSTVETESDFTTVEATSNGYFEDVKLEGKTLVNLCNNGGNKTVRNNGSITVATNRVFDANKDYTLVYFQKSKTHDYLKFVFKNIETGLSDYNSVPMFTNNTSSSITIVKKLNLPFNWYEPRLYQDTVAEGEVVETTFDFLILEGDHTQNPPSYFEGLKSVGQSATTSEDGTDEIVVSSVNENLLNLVDLGCINLGGNLTIEYMNSNNIKLNTLSTNTNKYISASFDAFKFIPNVRYKIKAKCTHSDSANAPFISVRKHGDYGKALKDMYEKNGVIEDTFVPTHTKHRIDFFAGNQKGSLGGTWVEFTDIQLSIDKDDFSYFTPHQSDKKRLLYYNNETQSWEKPVLRQWDSIEKHADGKYYYHQRSGEIVLNGSENWNISGALGTETTRFWTSNYTGLASNNNDLYIFSIISDLFSHGYSYNNLKNLEIEGVALTQEGYVAINILNSKLSTQDIQGFKQWLQANNVTVVYQLAQEKVYECTNIDLITFANETNYIVESGAIAPKSTLKVHNNISNVVSLLQKKVSLLENNVTSYMITQNRLMLASRYNADNVTFKVDYPSMMSEREVEIDYDLFKLIQDNIIVGPENYDVDKMLEIMDLYAMIGFITWEMWDYLYEVIDSQINPVIEDLEGTPEI